MRKFFLTLDLEEWYHLEYFQHLVDGKDRTDVFIHRLNNFLDLLEKYEIKTTVFILAELALKHPNIIKDLVERGHEIACHGLNHGLLYEKTDEQFFKEIKEAKEILENISGQQVIGYRAPCYSMEDKKLPLLKELGFKYDSSYIQFSQHDLYKMMNLDGYNKIEDLLFQKDGFYEFEIPTLKISKYNIPISGGGYFRLLPNFIYTQLFKKYSKKSTNFVFYIHPFELDPYQVHIPDVSIATRFRYNVGRKKVLSQLEQLIVRVKKQGYSFLTMKDYIATS